MSFSTFLTHFPVTHPRKVLCGLLLFTLLNTVIFLAHSQQATTTFLTKGPPWTKLFNAKQPMAAQEIVTVGILPRSEEESIFTPTALSFLISLDQSLQSLATVTSSSPQIIANDYLAPGNIDLAAPGDLGKIKLTRFLDATLDTPQLTEATVDQALQSPLLSNIFISRDGKAMALRLPCLISGQTQKIQQKLQHIDEHTDFQLLFSGLTFARENFFREIQKNIGPLTCISLALVVTLSLLIVFPAGYSCSVILPVICSTSFILAIQTLVQFPADIFSFLPPLIAACISLLFSIWLITALNSRVPGIEKQAAFKAEETTILFPQLWLISLASCGSLLCLCFSSLSAVRFLGCFAALAVIVAFLTTLLAVPATFTSLPSSWWSTKKKKNTVRSLPALLAKYTTQSTFPGRLAYACTNHWSFVVVPHTLFLTLVITGITLISPETTPIQWYAKTHWMQTAHQKNNHHFAGIDQLNLVLSATVTDNRSIDEVQQWLTIKLKNAFDDAPSFYTELEKDIKQTTAHLGSPLELSSRLTGLWRQKMNALQLEQDIQINRWSIALDILAHLNNEQQIFLRPLLLTYLADLQKHLEQMPPIGKALSVVDIVQSTHQALFEGAPEYKRIPMTIGSVEQALTAFTKKRPTQYLSRFISSDATHATLTLYLKDCSSHSIEAISKAVASYFTTIPPPVPLQYYWTGPAYGFKTWNEQAVSSLFLWAAMGLLTGCLIFSFCQRSLLYGLSIFAATSYMLICVYGVYGLLGMRFGAFIMAAIAIFIPAGYSFSIIMLHSLSTTVTEHGCLDGNLYEPFSIYSFPVIWSIAVVTFGCLPALFSAYCLLQTTAFMTISFMLIVGITFFTLFPFLCNLLQAALFKKEVLAFDKKTAQAAVTTEQAKNMTDTAPPLSPHADHVAETELKDVFTPQENTGDG